MDRINPRHPVLLVDEIEDCVYTVQGLAGDWTNNLLYFFARNFYIGYNETYEKE